MLGFVPQPNLRGIAFLTITQPQNWRQYIVSVDQLEEITGYNFLSNVPEHIQRIIKDRRVDFTLNAPLLADNEIQSSSSLLTTLSNALPSGFDKLTIGHNDVIPPFALWFDTTGSSKIDLPHASFIPNSTLQASPPKVTILNGCPSQVGISETSSFQICVNHADIGQSSAIQDSIFQVGIKKINIPEVGIAQFSLNQISTDQNSISQIRTPEISPSQVGVTQVEITQPQTRQINSAQINPTKISLPGSVSLQQFLSSYTHLYTSALTNTYKYKPLNIFDPTFNINLQITKLPTGQLAEAQITTGEANRLLCKSSRIGKLQMFSESDRRG